MALGSLFDGADNRSGQVWRLDVISQGPKRDLRLPPRRWLAVAAAAGLGAIVAAVLVTGTGGGHIVPPPRPAAAPSPSPAGAPDTVLRTCASAAWGQLDPNWRAGSVKAGPLWLVNGRQDGYVHPGRVLSAGLALPRQGTVSGDVMIVEVTAGSTVVMKPAAETRSYFRFLNGFGSNTGYQLPAGDTGFTLIACPPRHAGPNGLVTDFHLGFSINAGRTAPVEVWTPASPWPIWLTFTAPGRGD